MVAIAIKVGGVLVTGDSTESRSLIARFGWGAEDAGEGKEKKDPREDFGRQCEKSAPRILSDSTYTTGSVNDISTVNSCGIVRRSVDCLERIPTGGSSLHSVVGDDIFIERLRSELSLT